MDVNEGKRRMSINLSAIDPEKRLSIFFGRMQKEAEKAGYRAFVKIEPETTVVQGEVKATRAVTVELRPANARTGAALKRNGARALQGTDRYEELVDAEACIRGCFDVAMDMAKEV